MGLCGVLHNHRSHHIGDIHQHAAACHFPWKIQLLQYGCLSSLTIVRTQTLLSTWRTRWTRRCLYQSCTCCTSVHMVQYNHPLPCFKRQWGVNTFFPIKRSIFDPVQSERPMFRRCFHIISHSHTLLKRQRIHSWPLNHMYVSCPVRSSCHFRVIPTSDTDPLKVQRDSLVLFPVTLSDYSSEYEKTWCCLRPVKDATLSRTRHCYLLSFRTSYISRDCSKCNVGTIERPPWPQTQVCASTGLLSVSLLVYFSWCLTVTAVETHDITMPNALSWIPATHTYCTVDSEGQYACKFRVKAS